MEENILSLNNFTTHVDLLPIETSTINQALSHLKSQTFNETLSHHIHDYIHSYSKDLEHQQSSSPYKTLNSIKNLNTSGVKHLTENAIFLFLQNQA
jgi:hypothetical protein